MKSSVAVVALAFLGLPACGGSDRTGQPAPPEEGVGLESPAFDPPPAAEGFTRIEAPVMYDIAPGDDIMHCQYVQAPLDHDVDILAFSGYQSEFGHHAVAYATTTVGEVGSSGRCSEADSLSGGFLGGIGGEGVSGVPLPEGVAFRLPKGSGILLNTHFLNASEEVVDGRTVVDIEFVDVDPDRKVASMFANGTFTFSVPANGQAEAFAECTVPRDLEFVLYANHMHDFGTRVMTEVVRAATAPELVIEDPVWSYEMQFNAVFRKWDLDAPLHLAAGDTLRTRCEWNNTSAEVLQFPREMCFGVGFFIDDGSSSPVCADGAWLAR